MSNIKAIAIRGNQRRLIMKYKLFFGLFGCGNDGTLYTPSRMQSIKLPKCIAFKVQTFLNKFVYNGLVGEKLLFMDKRQKELLDDPPKV